jgi:hypothetical protein
LENQRTDVASVVSVQLMTIFFENLRRFVAERVFPKFKFIFKNNPGTGGGDGANGFITKPAESTVNEMKSIIARR